MNRAKLLVAALIAAFLSFGVLSMPAQAGVRWYETGGALRVGQTLVKGTQTQSVVTVFAEGLSARTGSGKCFAVDERSTSGWTIRGTAIKVSVIVCPTESEGGVRW